MFAYPAYLYFLSFGSFLSLRKKKEQNTPKNHEKKSLAGKLGCTPEGGKPVKPHFFKKCLFLQQNQTINDNLHLLL